MLDTFAHDLALAHLGSPFAAEPITVGMSGSQVWRLRPVTGTPVILKAQDPAQVKPYLLEDYPHIGEAERRFYTELAPRLGAPAPAVLTMAENARVSYLLLEDLALAHQIPPVDHVWTDKELAAVLDTYALLHGRSWRLFRQEQPPGWLHLDPRLEYAPETVLACFRRFADNPWTRDLAAPVADHPRLPLLVNQVASALDSEPAVLLYNDFWPANVALPLDGGPAKLFDWQLAGSGPAHVDIQNIGFLTGAPAFAQIDAPALLEHYLDTFAKETDWRPATPTFLQTHSLARLMGWGLFMPRMDKAMDTCNTEGRTFSPWMQTQFETCMAAWLGALQTPLN
jgi:hypothetical protein